MTKRSSARARATRSAKTEDSRSAPAASWPTLAEVFDWRAPYLIPGALLLATRIWMAFFVSGSAEDAYITFRFARNLANGFGLVFNPGERVFGFSSPLWTLWMAAGFKLGVAPAQWARPTTVALELVTLLIVATMLRRAVSNRSAWVFAFFWATWPYYSAVSVSGMENQAMVGLVALAAVACAGRSPWAGPALAAVAWIRPEGLAASAVLACWARPRDRWIAAALVVASLIALTLYFGSPIPQSLIAKSKIYGTPGPWSGRHWWEWLSPFIFGRFPEATDTGHLFLLSLVFTPAMVLGARALWSQRRQPIASFAAACLVVWVGYALLGVAYFWWYLTVPLTGLVVLAAVGLPRLARGTGLEISSGLLILGLWTLLPKLYLGRAQSEYIGFAGVSGYLSSHAQPGQKVFLEPIGMVGYGAPVRIIDEVGLVSPQVAARRMQGPGWYADIVRREQPDWLVLRRRVLTGGRAFAGAGAPFRDLAERDAVLSGYQVEAAIDTTSGDNTLVILSRRR